VSARRRTASTEIEGRILEAALQILDQRGIDGLTVRGIATEAGIAPMGIYSRFEGKTGIYEALWIEGFDRLAAHMERVVPSDDPLADMLVSGRLYREFALTNVAHYRLMFMRRASDYTPSADASIAAARPLSCLLGVVERAQVAGVMPADRSIDLAQAFWSAVHGFVTLELSGMVLVSDADRAYDTMLRALLEGFRVRSQHP
jgi:AcrR family transcriptional regulator